MGFVVVSEWGKQVFYLSYYRLLSSKRMYQVLNSFSYIRYPIYRLFRSPFCILLPSIMKHGYFTKLVNITKQECSSRIFRAKIPL